MDAVSQAERDLDRAMARYRAARARGQEHQRKYVSLAPSPRAAWHLAQWRMLRPTIRRLFDECCDALRRVDELRSGGDEHGESADS